MAELIAKCDAVRAGAFLTLTVQRKTPVKGNKVRLAGPGSPLGKVLDDCVEGQVVASFCPHEVKKWALKRGAKP